MRASAAERASRDQSTSARRPAWTGLLAGAARTLNINAAALDVVATNIMIADETLQIVYMNKAVMRFLTEA